MEQKEIMRNFTGTVVTVGLFFSAMNSTMVIDGRNYYEAPKANYSFLDETTVNNSISSMMNNIYEKKDVSRLEENIEEIFGGVRDATREEMDSVNKYIKSISVSTGVNFFDLC